MIVLPAVVAGLVEAGKAIVLSAGLGALIGGGVEAVPVAVTGYQEQGEINQQVVSSVAHAAVDGAAEGALVGGAFGAVGVAAGPVVSVARAPFAGVIDDIGRAAKPVINGVDDFVGPTLRQAGFTVRSSFNHARNALNARFFDRLPKTNGPDGYVYVMDDVAKEGRYKIGMTNNPARRLPEVEKKIDGKLNYSCIIPSSNMRQLESALHKEFAKQRLPDIGFGTEWFNLNPSQLTAACSR